MSHRYPSLLLIALLSLPISLPAEIGPEVRWADPSRVRLDVDFPGQGYHASWTLFRCSCGDLLVYSELNAPGEIDKGETLLIGGRAVLSRGFGEEQAELGASLDAPALMMQLALRLLERSVPGGPGAANAPVEVNLTEEINPILLDTASAIGTFQAPWSVRGEIAPSGVDQKRFDLHFDFSVPTPDGVQASSMRLKGVSWFDRSEFPVTGSEPLDGWQLTWRDPNDPAAGAAAGTGTLDELRSVLRHSMGSE